MSCRLIVNADDLGWSAGVNEAVAALYDEGVVTSASLMVGAPGLTDALRRVESRPGLAVGLHLVAVCGPALLPAIEIPDLVDRNGWLPRDPVRAGLRYTFVPACAVQLRREVQAQFDAFAGLGLEWSHVDSHLHFALQPVFSRSAFRCAAAYPVVGWRVPHDDLVLYRKIDPADAGKQAGLAAVFALLCRSQRFAADAAGYVTVDRCYGTFRTGRLDTDYLTRLIGEMPDGDYELHCHPDLSTAPGRREFEALRAPAVRRALTQRGVTLLSYPELARIRAKTRPSCPVPASA